MLTTLHHTEVIEGVSPLPDESELDHIHNQPSTSAEIYTVNKPKVKKKLLQNLFTLYIIFFVFKDSITLMVDSITTPEDEDTPRKTFLKKSVSMLAEEN